MSSSTQVIQGEWENSHSHPAIRPDDARKRKPTERERLKRLRKDTVRRLATEADYEIMKAARAMGLYSHRTSDRDIMRFIQTIRHELTKARLLPKL